MPKTKQNTNLKGEVKDLDINVNSVELWVNKNNDGKGYSGTEDDIWLAINVTYRNIGIERKKVDFGTISVIHNQKKYVFTRSDFRGELEWEMILDHQDVRTMDLVYKIPFEIQGAIYFEPENNYEGNRIYLGMYDMGKLA